MVFNRIGHVKAQAIIERVVAPHRALQFGELSDHIGHQIGLSQLRCLVSFFRQHVATQLLANRPGNRPHALDPLTLRAQLVVIDHLAQTFNA